MGLLITRYLFGLRGDALITDIVANDAKRTAPEDIEVWLQTLEASNVLDIDGDGNSNALTDGLLIIRYLFGLRGDALISGAVANVTSTTVIEIEARLLALISS